MALNLDKVKLSGDLTVGALASITATTGALQVGALAVGTSATAGYKLTATGTGGEATWQADTTPDHMPATKYNASATLSNTDGIIEFYGSTAAQALTLPQITGIHEGRRYVIANISSVSVDITPNAADKIGSGAAGAALALAAGDRISIVAGRADAAAPTWYIGV